MSQLHRLGPEDKSSPASQSLKPEKESKWQRVEILVAVSLDEHSPERELRFVGRCAWALIQLLNAGSAGCTPITTPGPRWSHYVFKLRRAGIVIETVTEDHGGPFAGNHARYVLRSKVRVLEVSDPHHQCLTVHDGGRP